MRIQEQERRTILSSISEITPGVRAYLFGSRTDDARRGGDIDILLIGKDVTPAMIRKLKITLKDKLGDQKIDILYEEPDHRTNFGKLAELEAIPL